MGGTVGRLSYCDGIVVVPARLRKEYMVPIEDEPLFPEGVELVEPEYDPDEFGDDEGLEWPDAWTDRRTQEHDMGQSAHAAVERSSHTLGVPCSYVAVAVRASLFGMQMRCAWQY